MDYLKCSGSGARILYGKWCECGICGHRGPVVNGKVGDHAALLPCPFCGSQAKYVDDFHQTQVICPECGASTEFSTTWLALSEDRSKVQDREMGKRLAREEVADWWNRRIPSREVIYVEVTRTATTVPECENVTSAAPGNPPEDGSPGNPASPISDQEIEERR